MKKWHQFLGSSILQGLIIATLQFSCSEIIEKNISKETLELISPSDSVVQYGTLTFWWTEMEGASQYRLQLITPSFSLSHRLILDTLVSSTRFDYNPDPGLYQWHVQGVNSAYVSPFSPAKTLEILDGSDLGRVKIVLRSPINYMFSNQQQVAFSWQKVTIADHYRLQIFSSSTVILDDTTAAASYQYTLPNQDATYQWQITAFNEVSQSMSEKYTITLDKTAPEAPQLLTPKEDSLVDFSSQLKFTWIRKSADVKVDNFSIVNADGTSVSGFDPVNLTAPLFELSNTTKIFKQDSTYIWRVISIDKASNKSLSSTRSFKVSVK
jgi:hypothetical protein